MLIYDLDYIESTNQNPAGGLNRSWKFHANIRAKADIKGNIAEGTGTAYAESYFYGDTLTVVNADTQTTSYSSYSSVQSLSVTDDYYYYY